MVRVVVDPCSGTVTDLGDCNWAARATDFTVGEHEVTYAVNTCIDTLTVIVHPDSLALTPWVSCLSDAPLSLPLTPSGAAWSGAGIVAPTDSTDWTWNAQEAGAGFHTLLDIAAGVHGSGRRGGRVRAIVVSVARQRAVRQRPARVTATADHRRPILSGPQPAVVRGRHRLDRGHHHDRPRQRPPHLHRQLDGHRLLNHVGMDPRGPATPDR